ncbi:MAG: glycosyltransferase [Prolixibacteraceae bacterium]|nr:glycosyltransferase [Prolixibacteraceae bacterium]
MDVLSKLIIISLRYPIKFIRRFSFSKIIVFRKALKNESYDQIITNFKNYLNGHTVSQKTLKKNTDFFSRDIFLKEKQLLLDEFLNGKTKLNFHEKNPELSILMILFNKAELTLAALKSLLKSDYQNFELIIVDNNSSDRTSELLNRIQGAKILRNSENLHFLRANNQACKCAIGEYLLFLNNDTELPPKTLGRAIETIKSVDNCGAVGGKIIFPEGTLQEAGSIVWNDGSCLGYGRHENPDLPQYNFIREVDYCSGAFLLTKTSLFRQYGGFDPLFEPAYYEETDYCFWLHRQGYKVIYGPKVVVNHFEFGSGISEKAIELHQINQEKFFKKHTVQLKDQCPPELSKTLIPRFAASARKKKRILYIDDRVPHCDFGSGFPRSNNIVNMIAKMDWLVTIYPLNFPYEDNWEIAYRDIDPFIEIVVGCGLAGFQKFIDEREGYYDLIWVSRPHNMEAITKSIEPLKDKVKIVYDAEAIFAEREYREKLIKGVKVPKHECDKLIHEEVKLAGIAHVIISVTENDANHFINYGFENITILGHCLNREKNLPAFSERRNLLFVGNLDYNESPNTDSVIWFVEEIWPLVKEEISELELDIVGSAKSEKIQNIKTKGINVHGRVDELKSFYANSRLFIAPTRFAAGIPFKIHEAAANGVPVVATKLLADQLGWKNNVELWAVTPDPVHFAETIVEVYTNKNTWDQIQSNAFQYIENVMSFEAYKRKLEELLNSTDLI